MFDLSRFRESRPFLVRFLTDVSLRVLGGSLTRINEISDF